MKTEFKTGDFYLGDTFKAMSGLKDKSIDMLLVDLPYGTTKNKWDSPLPFESLWEEYYRVCKEDAAMIFTASQPFTTSLINSNPKDFRYCLVWDKTKSGNFALANKQPMKSHEDVVVFYRKMPTYNPQKEVRGKPRKKGGGKASTNTGLKPTESFNNTYFPKSILTFSTGSRKDKFHPTQKPVELFQWLIRSYSDRGDVILDNTCGAATTAIAAIKEGRRWVCIEKEEKYFLTASKRIENEEGL